MATPYEKAFKKGITAFRGSNYEQALLHFDEAINTESGGRYNVYDSRAAVYEKLGRIKEALRDSRKVIELAPHMRHGYARSARLFLQVGKYQVALDMVRLALDRVEAHLAARRVELQELQRTISEARDARAVAEAQKLPQFSKLPVELISEVFHSATEVDIAFPVSASLVCRHWRTVALSIPGLWRSVALSAARPVKKLALWLERSKNQITHLRIRAGISKLQLRDALRVCGPGFSKALKSVHCEVDVHLLTRCFLDIPDIQYLDLDDIQIFHPKERQLENAAKPLAPLLSSDRTSSAHSLVVEYITVDWRGLIPRFSSLRILIIRTAFEVPGNALMCTLLSANPYLEKLIVETGSPMGVESVSTKGRIALPCLLHLELLGVMDTKGLVTQLSLPLLEHFVISHSLSSADQVLQTLNPPPLTLTELSVHKCSFSEGHLAAILRTLSRLVKLEITHSGSAMDGVVDAVAGSHQVNGETKLSCPQLQHVNFSHCSNLNGGPIVRLVKPRLTDNSGPSPPPARIESIYIDGCPRIDPAVPEWLRSRINKVSCIYMTKSEARKLRP